MAGVTGSPLAGKLGIRPGSMLCAIDPPANYWRLLGDLPVGAQVCEPNDGPFDLVHVFVTHKKEIEQRIGVLRKSIKPNGMIWVSWPKKSSGYPTDFGEDTIRDIALANGLVDTKVCAVDETWSGLKLVIRLKDRGKA